MLYACTAGFPRAAIDHRLHDDWGWRFITPLCDPGGSVRDGFGHGDRFRESLSEGFRSRPKAVPTACGVLSQASDVPVKPWLWPRHRDCCCEIALALSAGFERYRLVATV